MKNCLFIIDPQNDFCDPEGSLYVPGADYDIARICTLINMLDWKTIITSQDIHYYDSIFFPCFWRDSSGIEPNPFDQILLEDVLNHDIDPDNPGLYEFVCNYLEIVKEITIWPYHCIVGTEGSCFPKNLQYSIENIIIHKNHEINHNNIIKGTNRLSENYSVFETVFEAKYGKLLDEKSIKIEYDSDSEINMIKGLLDNTLNVPENHDNLFVCGEALSHCVLDTLESMKRLLSSYAFGKVTLIKDCCSIIPGCEENTEIRLEDLQKAGMKICNFGDLFKGI
jgi:nicotinamidase/pyrazinamidase